MSQTRTWLDGYIRAWRTKDEGDVRALFTDDAEYWFRPDDPEPLRGVDAIVEMWRDEEEPAEPVHALDVLVEDDGIGMNESTRAARTSPRLATHASHRWFDVSPPSPHTPPSTRRHRTSSSASSRRPRVRP